jgi:hypothetical protein
MRRLMHSPRMRGAEGLRGRIRPVLLEPMPTLQMHDIPPRRGRGKVDCSVRHWRGPSLAGQDAS